MDAERRKELLGRRKEKFPYGGARRLQGCEHEDAHPPAGGAYACPFGKCRCCGFSFPYVDSGSEVMRADGMIESKGRHHDKDLCDKCGGGYHEFNYVYEPKNSLAW